MGLGLLASCSQELEKPAPALGNTQQAITNGVDDVDTPLANATFFISTNSGECSGSLITSTLGLTAVHCRPNVGATVSFGLNNQAGALVFKLPPRAQRKVVAVFNHVPPSFVPDKGATPFQRARDVAIIRLDAPITMEASPVKPSFVRPTLHEIPVPNWPAPANAAVISGGAAGFGLRPFIDSNGGLVLLPPPLRQKFESSALELTQVEVGQGYGLWAQTARKVIQSGDPHTNRGDSGGPLFISRGVIPTRDVIGVLSGSWWDKSGCPDFLCGEELTTDAFADITAPTMRAWIESIVDRNGDGRWEGETDYARTTFGTPGCDVASNQLCDPSCNVAADPDCDLVFSGNDNCPNDYNPDQLNTDDTNAPNPADALLQLPNDPFDRSGPLDPGDACDLCPQLVDNGDNCNEDSEVLQWGPRPGLREDDVIGNPLAPAPAPIVSQVRNRYQGDACDNIPCTELSKQQVALDSAKYGAPSPVQCGASPLIGGTCSWAATSLVERNPTRMPGQTGTPSVGHTGYRFCQCDPPFENQADRLARCLAVAGGCPISANLFAVAPELKEMSVDPPFQTFTVGSIQERGTANDLFTFPGPSPRPAFHWLFESDQSTIMSTPNPILPLDTAGASGVVIDGLVQSNVRAHNALFPLSLRDLASHWMPMRLRVRTHIDGGKIPLQDFFRVPGWWRSPCKLDPNCRFGLSVPIYVFPRPSVTTALFGVTRSGAADVTDLVSETAQALLASPTATVIPAAEHANVLAARAAEFAPRLAFVDLETMTFEGAIAQGSDGRLVESRGIIIDPGGERAFRQCAGQPTVGCPGVKQGQPVAASAATLSGTYGALFVLARQQGEPGARLRHFNVLLREWNEIPLEGRRLPVDPIAMTFVSQHNALFVLARGSAEYQGKKKPKHNKENSQKSSAVHLYRIGLTGQADVLATLPHAWKGEVFLTPGEDGSLLVAASRDKPARFRIVQLQVGQRRARPIGRMQGKGHLAAAPFITRRGLTLPLDDGDGNLLVREQSADVLGPPQESGALWPLQP